MQPAPGPRMPQAGTAGVRGPQGLSLDSGSTCWTAASKGEGRGKANSLQGKRTYAEALGPQRARDCWERAQLLPHGAASLSPQPQGLAVKSYLAEASSQLGVPPPTSLFFVLSVRSVGLDWRGKSPEV